MRVLIFDPVFILKAGFFCGIISFLFPTILVGIIDMGSKTPYYKSVN